MVNNTQSACEVQGLGIMSASFQTLFPDRDLTAKNIRGFISDTKTPSSSHRYPETVFFLLNHTTLNISAISC